MKYCKLLFALLAFPIWAFSQSSPLFQDGKIWFKVTNEMRISYALKEDPQSISVQAIPGLESVVQEYGFIRLSKPFYAAKNSEVLQRTYLLEFSDVTHTEELLRKLQGMKHMEYAERVPVDKTCLIQHLLQLP
jgi:hypothetical protein